MKKNHIYLDYASTTPVDKKVLQTMLPYLKGEFGNPSSVHSLGQSARAAVEKAREQVALFLGCSANEIVFTSGATEANNLVIQGIARKSEIRNPKSEMPISSSILEEVGTNSKSKIQNPKPHIIISQIEHESVLAPVQELEKQGLIEATYVSVGKEGIVNPQDVEKTLKTNTVLVSIQYANSEVGTIQPIAEIGNRLKSKIKNQKSKVLFHTDAVQAANYLDCNVQRLGVDILTLSAHKMYGPKGVGALYIKKGIAVSPLFLGGGQEQNIRSGTENVAGIVGMGEAVKEIQNQKHEIRNIQARQLRDKLITKVLARIPGSRFTGNRHMRLPNNAHFLFEGVEGKDIVMLLDQKGIAASTGSACSERSQEPSHVLLSLGYSVREALSAVRFSLGKQTTKEEIAFLAKTLEKAVEQLRGKK